MAGPAPYLAQDSPVRDWVTGLVDFFENTLPVVFLVVVLLVGTILIVKSKGGLQKAIIFGIGAALVFLLLTNVESIAELFSGELPGE